MTPPDGRENETTPMLPLGQDVVTPATLPARGRGGGRHQAERRERPRLRWEHLPPYVLGAQGTAFGAWVLWLVETYALWELWPICWYRHPGLIEELTALWAWHVVLETETASDGPGAVSWHAALWRFVDRSLPPVTRRCLSSHQEPPTDVLQARKEMTEAMRTEYAAMLRAEISQRRTLTGQSQKR